MEGARSSGDFSNLVPKPRGAAEDGQDTQSESESVGSSHLVEDSVDQQYLRYNQVKHGERATRQAILQAPDLPETEVDMISYITMDEDTEFWTQQIHVRCLYGDALIAQARGRYIDRDAIRANFLGLTSDLVDDTACMTTELFDERGHFKAAVAQMGSGVWGDELSQGALLTIDMIWVDGDWRGQGVGTAVAARFVEAAHGWKADIRFVIVWPAELNISEFYHGPEVDKAARAAASHENVKRARRFWRKVGYRRIGHTSYFGDAVDPAHRMHGLAADDDWNYADRVLPLA
ncbi:uncharacterized protein L3040_001914 [Drepanopeziza brunnea f. sp. 'multigermtubi']|nr:hypothetical protein L3040_001914 [Drepanopeziza brunnea f. sp. 'multigermtubi']